MDALYSPLIQALLDKGQTRLCHRPLRHGVKTSAKKTRKTARRRNFFNTFNRTDDAERIYDIALALHHIPDGPTNIVGFGNAGLWTIIAGAISERTDLQIASDIGAFNTNNRERLPQTPAHPGILKAGGLPNARALIAPNNLLLHNTDDAFDTSWAEAAYALHPEATLTVKNDLQKTRI